MHGPVGCPTQARRYPVLTVLVCVGPRDSRGPRDGPASLPPCRFVSFYRPSIAEGKAAPARRFPLSRGPLREPHQRLLRRAVVAAPFCHSKDHYDRRGSDRSPVVSFLAGPPSQRVQLLSFSPFAPLRDESRSRLHLS